MNHVISKITDSELEVMKVLWRSTEAMPMAEIRKELEESSQWDTSTIKTLLRRLCQKGAVLAVKREVFYYQPLVGEREYHEYSTQSLIDRVFSGSPKNLIASLVNNKKLKESDLEELRAMFKVGEDHE